MPTTALAAILTMVLMSSQTTIAHDGPQEVLASLNSKILRNGPSAELLFRRATEFRAMRDYKHAAADLSYAVRMDGSLEIARLELARLQLQILKSESASAVGDSRFNQPLQTVEPLLTSSDAAIRIADAKTQSPVVKAALCDALIDAIRQARDSDATSAEMIREATSIIDVELSTSRLKSAWQIRRAELLLLCDDRHQAETELHAAIEELNARLQTQRPDPALLRDRDHAVKLLNP